MYRFFTSLFLLLVLAVAPLKAQYATDARTETPDFKAQQLVAPAVLLTTGTLLHCFSHDALDVEVRDMFLDARGTSGEVTIDDYIQYLPSLASLTLGFFGVEAEHDFFERGVQGVIGAVTLIAVNRSMKALIYSPRPNGVDAQSFPSGHTGTAFLGAELVRKEYGWGWGSAAYAVATTTAVLRMYNNEHWLSDVIAGAGLGILCANVGTWLRDPVTDLLHLDSWLRPVFDPISGLLCAQVGISF